MARWKLLNAPHLVTDGDMRAPSATFEYMLYQTLIGAWQPDDGAFVERIQAYALKAAREGKQETSWLNPNPAYEAGLNAFIARILDRSQSAEFLDSLRDDGAARGAARRIEFAEPAHAQGDHAGRAGFLSGHGILGFSLVDPDNRRPVDFAARASALGTWRRRTGSNWRRIGRAAM